MHGIDWEKSKAFTSPQKNVFGDIVVDTLQEIAVNKWCTLLGRNEIKDLIDLYFLSKHIDIWVSFEQAKTIEELKTFQKTICDFLDRQSFPEH